MSDAPAKEARLQPRMENVVTIENGFAVVGARAASPREDDSRGLEARAPTSSPREPVAYLASHGQPAAFLGAFVERRRKGFFLRDRARLSLLETSGRAWFADAARPFLTHIPCAAPIFAVSSKILLAPAVAWAGAELVKTIPMSFARAIPVSSFEREWVVTATASRTTRVTIEEGETLSVRPESLVAWTGNRPTGFCPRLGILDFLLPRPPRNFLLHFHGPATLWLEGATPTPTLPTPRRLG